MVQDGVWYIATHDPRSKVIDRADPGLAPALLLSTRQDFCICWSIPMYPHALPD